MDRGKSREYTKEEIINLIFKDIDSVLGVYEKNGEENNSLGSLSGEFIGACVMNALDGTPSGYPYMELAVIDERVDIHGVLHSLFWDSDEHVKKLLCEGVITEMTAEFVRKVKTLTREYDNNPNMETEELVASIFDVVDNGINGKEYRLSVFGINEDKYEAISYGENYFPTKPITISGELGKKYREMYLQRKEENEEQALENENVKSKGVTTITTIDPSRLVKHAIIGKKIPEGKVDALTSFWKEFGKMFVKGGKNDER